LVAAVSPSATLAVDAKAKALAAAGADVIGFGAGEPDFPTPAHIVEAAVAACYDPVNHHYTPTAGIAPLREAIAAKTGRDSGYEVAASQVLVTNGAKQAVYEAFATVLDPGDEVLVPAPYWTTYPEVIALAGGIPVAVPTDESTGFHLTVDALEAALTPATKVLLFVSPNNPTGAVSTPEEVLAIGRWAADRGLWVVTDEIYEHLVYGGRAFRSMPAAVPELADRCIVINGVAKTYAMTGWRVGWMIGPPDVVAVGEMRAAFERRRVTIHSMLNDCHGVTCVEPEGAFYAFPSVRGLLGRRLAGRLVSSSADVATVAIEESQVAVVPGEAFGAEGYLRLSYALGDDAIVEGVTRLGKLFATAE
jgi:aspartate/methionine/tyrosine aminotransferase